MKIDYVNEEYEKLLEKWDTVDDICDVESVEDYIEYLNPLDQTAENVSRNLAYRARAVFYELASFTRQGLLGMIFRKWPTVSIPAQIEYVLKNIDGKGNSIYQQSQQVAKSVIGKGKAGLLVDFPPVDNDLSIEDMNTMRYVSTITKIEPQQILLPVETISIGADVKLSKVRFTATVRENEEDVDVIRVLELLDGIYVSSEYRKTKDGWSLYKYTAVKGADGKYLDEIPFIFVGAENNTYEKNKVPMYGICRINIGHYNNSAAYEDSVHTVGQVQPWASGLTVADVKEMEAEGMYFGSGRLIGVASGEQLGFAQAAPNMLSREAMDKKVQDIIGLGGMFIMPGSATKTATQSEGEQIVQHSILSLIASNISEAYTSALQWVCRFMGIEPPEDMEYTLCQDFVAKNADAQMFSALLQGVLSGKLTESAFINWLQKMGIEDQEKTVDEIKEELSLTSGNVSPVNLDDEDEGGNGNG